MGLIIKASFIHSSSPSGSKDAGMNKTLLLSSNLIFTKTPLKSVSFILLLRLGAQGS